MTSRDFAYWLQGFFEITGTNKIDEGQAEMIKNHLNLVFKHEIDPSLNGSKSKEEIQDLQDIHDGKVDWKKMLEDGKTPKKDQDDVVDYLNGLFTNKPHKLHGGFSSGSSDGTLYRC
jgi:hypothetical protein